MERLGLWGEGATFKSFEQFIDTVQRKGLGKRSPQKLALKNFILFVFVGLK